MFQQLMKQVMELSIDTEERLKGVIDLVFEKAISEPNFSVAYANMCRCLMGVSRSWGGSPAELAGVCFGGASAELSRVQALPCEVVKLGCVDGGPSPES